MKRFLIIFVSLAVVLLPLSVSADDITTLEGTSWEINDNFSTSVNTNFRIVFESMGNTYDNIDISYGTIYYASGTDRTLVANNALPDQHWLIPDGKIITIVSGRDVTNSSLINWLSNNASPYIPPSDPLDELGVSGGVSSFIQWTGYAIRDIINSPFILPLICLSVALFFALPWVISKIKSLIKGY